MDEKNEIQKLKEQISELEHAIKKVKKDFYEAISELDVGNFSKSFIDKHFNPRVVVTDTVVAKKKICADRLSCESSVVAEREAHENEQEYEGETQDVELLRYSEDNDYDDYEADSSDTFVFKFLNGRFAFEITDNYSSTQTTKELKIMFDKETFITLQSEYKDGKKIGDLIWFNQDVCGI